MITRVSGPEFYHVGDRSMTWDVIGTAAALFAIHRRFDRAGGGFCPPVVLLSSRSLCSRRCLAIFVLDGT